MELYDENEHCKTVFARAGSALYHAQVLESSIEGLLVATGAVSGNIVSLAAYDEFEKKLRGYTLGRLLREFHRDATLNAKAEEIIDRALDRRNFLAHHFFKERAVEIMGREGRESMIDELVSYENLFVQANAIISVLHRALAAHLGAGNDQIQAEFDSLVKQAR